MMLFTPGPVDVHPDILAAAGRAPLHHRSPEFLAMSDRVWKRLADTFQTSGPALLVSGSGMTGIEAAIASLHPRGSTVLILSHGRFGDRLPVIAERYGIRTVVRSVPWGQTITASMVGDALASSPDVDGVWMVHAETSTGVALDLQSIAQTIRAHAAEVLIGVDVVTSLAVQPLAMDDWGIDAAIAGLQKGLACVPGMAAVALSHRALERLDSAEPPTYTLNLRTVLDDHRKGLFTWTPAVTVVAALDAALDHISADGLQARWELHRDRHTQILQRCLELGLTPFGDGTAQGVVTIRRDHSDAIRRRLRDTHGILIAGGQDHLSGRIFRIGTMGYRTDADIPKLLNALEQTLKDLP